MECVLDNYYIAVCFLVRLFLQYLVPKFLADSSSFILDISYQFIKLLLLLVVSNRRNASFLISTDIYNFALKLVVCLCFILLVIVVVLLVLNIEFLVIYCCLNCAWSSGQFAFKYLFLFYGQINVLNLNLNNPYLIFVLFGMCARHSHTKFQGVWP